MPGQSRISLEKFLQPFMKLLRGTLPLLTFSVPLHSQPMTSLIAMCIMMIYLPGTCHPGNLTDHAR